MNGNYLDDVARRVEDELGETCEQDLLRLYALLVLTVGENVTLENVHDAWAAWMLLDGWRYGVLKDAAAQSHPALVPFGQLDPRTQQLDAKYARAIRNAARALRGHDRADTEGRS